MGAGSAKQNRVGQCRASEAVQIRGRGRTFLHIPSLDALNQLQAAGLIHSLAVLPCVAMPPIPMFALGAGVACIALWPSAATRGAIPQNNHTGFRHCLLKTRPSKVQGKEQTKQIGALVRVCECACVFLFGQTGRVGGGTRNKSQSGKCGVRILCQMPNARSLWGNWHHLIHDSPFGSLPPITTTRLSSLCTLFLVKTLIAYLLAPPLIEQLSNPWH